MKDRCGNRRGDSRIAGYGGGLFLLLLIALAGCGPVRSSSDHGLRAITAIPTAPPTLTPVSSLGRDPQVAHDPPIAHDPTSTTGNRTPVPTTIPPAYRTCSDDEIAQVLRAIPAYVPGEGSFVRADGADLVIDGERFVVQGVTLVPSREPWRGVFAEDLGAIGRAFARVNSAGVNTVRVFVPSAPLFRCPGHGAVPQPDAVAHLDAVIRLARAFDLRVIIVLHHGADLIAQPLYTTTGDTLAQTAYIINRYHDEPAILAWDVRDHGDQDYAVFGRDVVLNWLSRMVAALRTLDANHLITAGWSRHAGDTRDLVDVVSVQHFGTVDDLRQTVAALDTLTGKPLLLSAFGASVQDGEAVQADTLLALIRAAENDPLAGWVVWSLEDAHPDPSCAIVPCRDSGPHADYGLWRADGSRRAVADALETMIHREQ